MDMNFDFPEDYIYPKIGDFLKREYYNTDFNVYRVLNIEDNYYTIEKITNNYRIMRIYACYGTGFDEFKIITEKEAKDLIKIHIFR